MTDEKLEGREVYEEDVFSIGNARSIFLSPLGLLLFCSPERNQKC
jgi:hypothetical protein